MEHELIKFIKYVPIHPKVQGILKNKLDLIPDIQYVIKGFELPTDLNIKMMYSAKDYETDAIFETGITGFYRTNFKVT